MSVGKVKKHQQNQLQYKLNKIATLIDDTDVTSKYEEAFVSGLEYSLSILESRDPVYKFYEKPSIFKRIQSVYITMKSVLVRGN